VLRWHRCDETKIILKLLDFCSIYTAETLAVYNALDIIKQDKINNSFILSTLISIKNYLQPNSISQKIQNQISSFKTNAQAITMIWIPSYIGIHGNELNDTYVKQAITSPN